MNRATKKGVQETLAFNVRNGYRTFGSVLSFRTLHSVVQGIDFEEAHLRVPPGQSFGDYEIKAMNRFVTFQPPSPLSRSTKCPVPHKLPQPCTMYMSA